ncbi:CBS domain-containing protein [Candidatus Woesearchaeota archaeon]|nr:CBS domain-containing protein [Candidatus Woesearchaeota archaeon]
MNKRGAISFLSKVFRGNAQTNCFAKLSSTHVSDIMIKDVLCCQKTEKLTEAAHVMIGAHASCLVVLEGDKPIGIITERDFVKKLSMEKDSASQLIVDDIMTKKLFSVNHHASLVEAQKIMREHSFRKLLVIENDELRGIITQTDLCWAVADLSLHYSNSPLVRNTITRKVLTVAEDDKFLKAKKQMVTYDRGSVIVVSKGEVRGMFTEFDMVSEFFLNSNRLRNSYMKDLMTAPVICITPDFTIFEINQIMINHNFRRLPVLENNKLIGIITQTDIARAMYEFIEKNKESACIKAQQSKEPIYDIKKQGNIILYQRKKKEEQKKVEKEEQKEEPKEQVKVKQAESQERAESKHALGKNKPKKPAKKKSAKKHKKKKK